MAWAARHRFVSPPGSSNRACRFPAFGFARGEVKNSFPASTLLLLLATSGGSDHAAGTTTLPPANDIRAPKSAFALISSAEPPGADSQDGGAVGPEVVESGCGAVAVGSTYQLPAPFVWRCLNS